MNYLPGIIIVGIIGVGIGFALGSLLVSSRGEHAQANNQNQAPRPNLVRIANLWTERGKKIVYLELGGKLIRDPNGLSEGERTRLKPYIESLSAWFLQPMDPPQSAPTSLPPRPTAEEPGTQYPVAPEASSADLKRPSMNPVNVITRAIQADVTVPESSNKSIAVQVDEILQEKIKGTPLEKRGIHLMELPNKGMVVMVGLDQYDSVDAVPDDEVRSSIRSAVAEWEKRVSSI